MRFKLAKVWIMIRIPCFILLLCDRQPHIRGSPRITCRRETAAHRDLRRNRRGSVRFDLGLIKTCTHETCGQIAGENFIRLDLIEPYQAQRRPTVASGLHLSFKWKQVISRSPQILLKGTETVCHVCREKKQKVWTEIDAQAWRLTPGKQAQLKRSIKVWMLWRRQELPAKHHHAHTPRMARSIPNPDVQW